MQDRSRGCTENLVIGRKVKLMGWENVAGIATFSALVNSNI